MSKKALVIDGNSLIYRSFYATYQQMQKNNNGRPPLNAVKLVLLITLKLLRERHYDYALVALDHEKKTLRHDKFADYKANRKPMPEALVSQLPIIKESFNIAGLQTLSIPGIEADDIIGSFCNLMQKQNIKVDIYTSDKDMLQLVNHNNTLYLLKTGISETIQVTEQNFGQVFFNLKPNQVTDFKGISGDSSDNLPGVMGIGPKTAVELIGKYGSLERIYDCIQELSPGQQSKFNNSKANAFLCKELSTIQMDILPNSKVEDFTKSPLDKGKLQNLINKYHFTGLDKYLVDIQVELS